MRTKKLISSLLICAMLLTGAMPFTTNAASQTTIKNNSIVFLSSQDSYKFSLFIDVSGNVTISTNNIADHYVISVAQQSLPYKVLCSWKTIPKINSAFSLTDELGLTLTNGTLYKVWVAAIVNGEIQDQTIIKFTYQRAE